MLSKSITAIDLGYGHVKFATRGASDGPMSSFPSYVGIGTGGTSQFALQGLGRIDVVNVVVNGRQYVVGPDAALVRSTAADRNRDTSYSTSDQYMALMLGAFWQLKQTVIDVLVIGLPMNTLQIHAKTLKEKMLGVHTIPNFMTGNRGDGTDNLVVSVKDVYVIGQPVGALMDVCRTTPEITGGSAIVLDMGFNTLDLLCMENRKPRSDRSDAFPGGVAGYIDEIARSVNEWVKKTYPDITDQLRLPSHHYEKALKENKPLQTGLGPIDLQPHAKVAESRIEQYMDQVAAKLGIYSDISVAVLAGGGARLIENAFRRRFPLVRRVIVADDPQFSVVRGYLNVGESQVAAYA
jgi:plasmid segregation protein ParM